MNKKENSDLLESEEFEGFQEEIIKAFMPYIIANLISTGLIDKSRIKDKAYIIESIKSNIGRLPLPRIHVETYETHKRGMISEIEADRKHTSIVLASVTIEHILNFFYRDILNYNDLLSDKEVSTVLSRLRIPDKIGWFFKLLTKREFPCDLEHKIATINSIRNKIIHYQAIPEDLDQEDSGIYNYIESIIKDLDINVFPDIIAELKEYLDTILINEISEIAVGREICSDILGINIT